MNKFAITGLFVVAGVAIAAIFVTYQQKNSAVVPATTSQPSPSSSAVPISTNGQMLSDLLVGGSSYLDPQGVFSLLYPADYQLDTQDPLHTRIYKTGATQRGQTEMYDGVLIVFETISLTDQTLEEWVDTTINTSTADGTLTVTQPKKSITLNGHPGYTYSVRGLGESTYWVLQKDPQSKFAVNLTTAIHDPENVGYQSEVDAIFATLELLK